MSTVTRRRSRIILGPELNGTLMTPEEFDAVEDYDENYVYELIHGVLIVNPIPLETEVGPNEYLGHLLLGYWERDLQKIGTGCHLAGTVHPHQGQPPPGGSADLGRIGSCAGLEK